MSKQVKISKYNVMKHQIIPLLIITVVFMCGSLLQVSSKVRQYQQSKRADTFDVYPNTCSAASTGPLLPDKSLLEPRK